jgi:murein DD-endopeptidase MepM/ murein hydrolase activator NlpD
VSVLQSARPEAGSASRRATIHSGGRVSRRFWIASLIVILVGGATLATIFAKRRAEEQRFARAAAQAQKEAQASARQRVIFSEHSVPRGTTLSAMLARLGVDAQTAAQVIGTTRPVFNLRHIQAGNSLALGRSLEGELHAVRYEINSDRVLWVRRQEDGFRADIRTIPTRTDTVGVTGRIDDSLFGAVIDAGESPELAMRLAEIFGWDLDFYTDPRPGDTFRVAVEKKTYLDGKLAGYGKIYAAEYDNAGRNYQAVLFHDPAGRPAYYQPDGQSLQKMFLRSPLKFSARITSHFSYRRFHPVLKRYRPHLGIDYGAPVGTPVQSIGAGRVVEAGTQWGAGRFVKIRHANGYQTMYLHLSRILVQRGQRVEQGQRIGLVGRSGHLATGPHLDFRVLLHGKYLNFERLNLPPTHPVAKRDWKEFAEARDHSLSLLPPSGLLQADAGTGNAGAPSGDARAGR